MSYWEYSNVGFICNANKRKDVKELLECMGIDFNKKHVSEDGDVCEILDANDYGSYQGEYEIDIIYAIVNTLYNDIKILYSYEEGSSISDDYYSCEMTYDPHENKIYIYKSGYTNGEEDEDIKEIIDIPEIEIDNSTIQRLIQSMELRECYNLIEQIKNSFGTEYNL